MNIEGWGEKILGRHDIKNMTFIKKIILFYNMWTCLDISIVDCVPPSSKIL